MTLLQVISILKIMFAPNYCYKQLILKCDYVLQQVQPLSLV